MTVAEKKVVRQRLSVLQLAEALSNVSEACRRRGMSRSQFYEYKRRFQTHGLQGLRDLPPVHKSHPMATPPEVVERILALSAENPMWGCTRLSQQLKLSGISVSSPTIQNILAKHGLASRYERLLKLEDRAAKEGLQLTPSQVAAIERANPCFRERHVESSRPGELLAQDTFFVGHLKGVGKVWLQAVVDTFGSYGFAYLHTGKMPEHAVAVLHNDVLPQYETWAIAVGAVLSDNGREYCGKETHPYELYLALNDIQHKRARVGRPQTNGFVERFNRTLLDEFFRRAFREKLYESIEALQKDLDRYLKFYNTERPHQGYRNMGKRPIDTVREFVKSSGKKPS
ncbi:MAG: IS481 family transposase [Dehalococcoidia bacterium]